MKEIQEWPKVIEIVGEFLGRGECSPQLHGYEHIDYGKQDMNTICKHLDISLEWFNKTYNFEPTVWATPWGACNDTMLEACELFDLKLETTQDIITPSAAIKIVKRRGTLKSATVMEHWWKRGLNLLRVAKLAEYNYIYSDATAANPELF